MKERSLTSRLMRRFVLFMVVLTIMAIPVLYYITTAYYAEDLTDTELIQTLVRISAEPYERKVSVPYGQDVEKAISKISAAIHKGHEQWLQALISSDSS